MAPAPFHPPRTHPEGDILAEHDERRQPDDEAATPPAPPPSPRSRRFNVHWRRLRPSSWRTFTGGFVLGGVVALLVGVLVIAPMLLTHRRTWPLENQVAGYALSMAARLHAGSKSNPNTTADRRTLERGQNAFTGSCAQCHGNAGDGKNAVLGQTLFPPA